MSDPNLGDLPKLLKDVILRMDARLNLLEVAMEAIIETHPDTVQLKQALLRSREATNDGQDAAARLALALPPLDG